jgi:ribulose-phosphate 3-epimerase
MPRRTLIAPSILSADFGRLAEEVRAITEAGADYVHVDVMDGHFVPNITIGPLVAAAAKRSTSLPVDVHLMIEQPERYLRSFAEAGASCLTVHQETCPHLHRTLQQIREMGIMAGAAVNPATPVETISEVIPVLDMVLVMSVNPGFGGQRFISGSEEKVRRARRMLVGAGSDALIEVDGGVTSENAAGLARAGADVLVAGSSVFHSAEGVSAAISAIRAAACG